MENTPAVRRPLTVVAIALVVLAIGLCAWLAGGAVADATGAGDSASAATVGGQTHPVQYGTQDDRVAAGARHDGRDCPERGQGGGEAPDQSAPQAAPSGSTSGTEL